MMPVVLAQFSQFLPTPPSPLPSPALVPRLLFEEPWPLALLAAAIGIGACFAWRGRRGTAGASAGLIVAAGLVLLGTLVRTDREQMSRATTSLVAAVAEADTTEMDRLLAEDARVYSRYQIPGYTGRELGMGKAEILTQVPAALRGNPISEHRILEHQAASRGPGVGTTQILVKIVVNAAALGQQVPIQSWWQVDWRRGADGQWRATKVEPLSLPVAATGS